MEDRYFVSGSFDKKLRIWNIPEHRVVEWAQTSNIITAAAFSPSGNMAVAGLYNGSCVFYQTDGLKYFTQVRTTTAAKEKQQQQQQVCDAETRRVCCIFPMFSPFLSAVLLSLLSSSGRCEESSRS